MTFTFYTRKKNKQSGLTLVETIVGAAVFLIIALGVYEGYIAVISLLDMSRAKTAGVFLASEKIEIIRNVPYEDVGTVGGIPPGIIPQVETVVRGGFTFIATTTVRSVDDPFDGKIGGTPNDLSPADYKKVEVTIGCSNCRNFTPIVVTTTQAPKNLETSSGNGALFIRVFDANGQPIEGATVQVINTTVSPVVNLSDLSGQDGWLQLVDVPPSVNGYEITVSKSGYSSDQTYPLGDVTNPNPTKPHATVATSTVTQISFAIDEESVVNWKTVSSSCQVRANIPFTLSGSKLKGTTPDVLKYRTSHTTNGSGVLSLSGLEWDTYSFLPTSPTYDLSGSSPLLSMSLAPGAVLDAQLVFELKQPRSLLVSVKDGNTGLPVAGATVTLSQTPSFNETLITNRGFLRQSDWSGGGGQSNFIDPARYESSDGNIETTLPAGDVTLKNIFGQYVTSGTLTSSTFDTGSATTTYYNIFWQPLDQPPDTGSDPVRFQIATNNDNTTWNYIGPDGTGATYYTPSDQNINSIHNGEQYLRYRLYLNTASSSYTPNVSDLAITFGSVCVPYGQVFFQNLSLGDYTVSVSKSGYQPSATDITINQDWQLIEIVLTP